MANYLIPSVGRPIAASSGGTASKRDLITVDDMYLTKITSRSNDGESESFTGYVPEDFNIDLSGEWEPFGGFSELIQSVAGSGVTDVVQTINKGAIGGKLANKFLTPQVWNGPSYLSLDLPIELNAWENTKKDVVDPIKSLMKLIAPSTSPAGMVNIPGPSPVEQIGRALQGRFSNPNQTQQAQQNAEELLAGRIITVEIGTFFRMEPCIITNVNTAFDALFEHGTGLPISSVVNVQVQSYYPVMAEDIENWFNPGSSSVSRSAGGN